MPELANAQRRPSDPVSAGARTAHARQGQGREGEAPLAAGNQALQRRLGAARPVQTRLEVSQPGDAWEREADAAAARVMRTPDASAGIASAAPPAISRLPAGAGPLGRKEAAAPEDDRKQRKATEKEANEAKAKAAAKEGEAAKKTEKEKKKEEDESKKMVHPLAIAGERARADEGVERAIEARRGLGAPLPAEERAFFEPRFGRRLDHVRVHADAAAARAAREVRAQAFATGNDVFFGAGRYQPGTPHGRALLAHELAHTIQQSPGPSLPAREPARPASPAVHPPAPPIHTPAPAAHAPANASVPRPGAPAPSAAPPRASSSTPAPRASAPPTAPRSSAAAPGRAAPTPARVAGPAPAPAAARMVARAPAPAAAPKQPAAPGGGGEVVPLTASFQPPASVAARIEAAGKEGADVQVALGRIATGTIRVREKKGGKKDDQAAAVYETVDRKAKPAHQPIPITHPLLDPIRGTGIEPVLAVKVADGVVEGYASVAAAEGKVPRPEALKGWMRDHPRELGWAGLDKLKFPAFTNELSGGTLKLGVPDFAFTLGGFVDGKGSLALANEMVTFSASATIKVPNLTTATLDVTRREDGSLYGRAEVPVSMANFSGTVIGEFGNGTFNMQGTAAYSTEKMSGEVTLVVTDEKTAAQLVADRLGAQDVKESAQETAGTQSLEAKAPPTSAGPKPGPRAVAGWGTLNFHFTEWMAGSAEVVVDAAGDITVRGEIAPPAKVELFAQRDYRQDLFDFEVRAQYGIPLVASVFIFANLGMDAVARLGPGTLYNIKIQGEYSTSPKSLTKLSIQGTLNISAYAGLEMGVEGGAGLTVLGHDVKAGVGVKALAGIKGYAEATPTLGYEEKADPKAGKRGQFFLRGHMEIAAQPFLGLGGDLFVELDSPWWSPAPDKKWTWPLGQMEYPLPGQFGIGADIDYAIGSGQLPEVKFGSVAFDKEKFLTDLVREDVPRTRKGDKEQKGSFTEKGGGTPDTAAAGQAQVTDGGKDKKKDPELTPAKEDAPAPAVIKAAALSELEKRIRGGKMHSLSQLQGAVSEVYGLHASKGLKSLDVDVTDEKTFELGVSAAASAPEMRSITWEDAFGKPDESKEYFESQGEVTYAAISVNQEMIGDVTKNISAKDKRFSQHAEAVLLDTNWYKAMDRVRALQSKALHSGKRTQVVLAINRSPCHEKESGISCTQLLVEALEDPNVKALLPTTDFILAPTGTYEPREEMPKDKQEQIQADWKKDRVKLVAAGEVERVRKLDREGIRIQLAEAATKASDLSRLIRAGWDVRVLLARPVPTEAGRILGEAAHHLAVDLGKVSAGGKAAGKKTKKP